MKKYKIYILIFFIASVSLNKSISCEFDCDTYSCFGLGKILNSLVCFNDDEDSPKQEVYAKLLSRAPSLRDLDGKKDISGYFSQLSEDEILSVSVYLNPTEIRKLSISCSGLLHSINKSVWKQYNVIHNYHQWELPLSSMRISYACFYYKMGRIDMAAKLGHPEALHHIRKSQNEKAVIINYEIYHDTDSYYDSHFY
jgi:hypothetical protein